MTILQATFLRDRSYIAVSLVHFFVDILNNSRSLLVALLAVGMGLSNAQVGGLTLRPGSEASQRVQEFYLSVGDRPLAIQALRRLSATDLRRVATLPDGTLDTARAQRWIDRHSDFLREAGLSDDFGNVTAATRAVDNLTEQTARSLDQVERSAIRFYLGRRGPGQTIVDVAGGVDSVTAMRGLLGSRTAVADARELDWSRRQQPA